MSTKDEGTLDAAVQAAQAEFYASMEAAPSLWGVGANAKIPEAFTGTTMVDQAIMLKYHEAINSTLPVDVPMMQVGVKYDAGKPDYTLLPFGALGDVVEVLGFGAVKYGRDNWQKVGRQRYVAAAFRHLIEIAKGNEFDEESGKPHAAHLTCCSLFIGELGRPK